METTFNYEAEADFYDRPDADEMLARNPFWNCEHCNAQNSRLDGECQYCEPEEIESLENA